MDGHPSTAENAPGRPFKAGEVFKNGKLYVFSDTTVAVLRGWPDPMAWKKTKKRGWICFRPRIRMLAPDLCHDFEADSVIHRKGFDIAVTEDDVPGHIRRIEQDIADSKMAPGDIDRVVEERFDLRDSTENEKRFYRWIINRNRRRHEALGKFFETIPAETRSAIRGFADRQWHLLSMLARCPGALELTLLNPALAFCLASNWVFHEPPPVRPLQAARSLLPRRMRDIAGWLGFPPTQNAVQILAKVPRESCTVPALLNLRRCMAEPDTLKWLSHLPRVTHGVISLLHHPAYRPFLTFNFLEETALKCPAFCLPGCLAKLDDCQAMNECMARENAARPLKKLGSSRALAEYHDELVDRLNEINLANQRRGRVVQKMGGPSAFFPSPPLPGNEHIIPLTTPEQLELEGRLQRNCVGSYAPRVRARQTYIYRVLEPERATLSIVRSATTFMPSVTTTYVVSANPPTTSTANKTETTNSHALSERFRI